MLRSHGYNKPYCLIKSSLQDGDRGTLQTRSQGQIIEWKHANVNAMVTIFSVDIVYDNSALNKELTTKVQIDHVITAPHCIIPNCVETSPCHIPVLLARPEKVGKWGCLARNVAITHIVLGSLVGVFHIYFLAVTRYILYFELMVKAQYNTSQTAMKVGLTLAQWQDDSTDIGPMLGQPTLLSET